MRRPRPSGRARPGSLGHPARVAAAPRLSSWRTSWAACSCGSSWVAPQELLLHKDGPRRSRSRPRCTLRHCTALRPTTSPIGVSPGGWPTHHQSRTQNGDTALDEVSAAAQRLCAHEMERVGARPSRAGRSLPRPRRTCTLALAADSKSNRPTRACRPETSTPHSSWLLFKSTRQRMRHEARHAARR